MRPSALPTRPRLLMCLHPSCLRVFCHFPSTSKEISHLEDHLNENPTHTLIMEVSSTAVCCLQCEVFASDIRLRIFSKPEFLSFFDNNNLIEKELLWLIEILWIDKLEYILCGVIYNLRMVNLYEWKLIYDNFESIWFEKLYKNNK